MQKKITIALVLVAVSVIGILLWNRSTSESPNDTVIPTREAVIIDEPAPQRSLASLDANEDWHRFQVQTSRSNEGAEATQVSLPRKAVETKPGQSRPSYSIIGTLVSPSGSSATSGRVQLCDGNMADPPQSVLVQSDGWFSFQLPGPGHYSLVGTHEAYSPSATLHVEIGERTPSITTNVQLSQPASITGSVHLEMGDAIKHLLVVAHPRVPADLNSSPALARCFESLPPVEATTGNEGEFTLQRLQPDLEFDIACTPDPSRPDCTIVEQRIKPGTTGLEIVVREQRLHGAFVHGRLLDVATRQAVKDKDIDLWIAFKRPAGDWATVLHQKLDSGDGTFRVDGLSPGTTYGMETWASKFPPKKIGPWLASPEGTQFEVLLGRSGQLDVTVLSGDGRPVPGASATAVFEKLPIFPWEGKASGADAKAHFFDLDPGIYTVTASKDGSVGNVTGVTVRDAETVQVELRLPN